MSEDNPEPTISSRLLSSGMWMVIGRVSTLFLGLVVSGLLARILSPENMGVFVFVESLVLTAGIFAQLGLGHTAVRLIARSLTHSTTPNARNIVFHVIELGAFGGVLATLTLFFLGPYLGITEDVIVWACAWVFIFAIQQLLADIFRGFHDFRSVVLIAGSKTGGMISTGIAAVLLFFLWRTAGNLELVQIFPFFLAGSLPAILLGAIALVLKLRSDRVTSISQPEVVRNFSRKQILRLAFPVLVTALTAILLSRSGIWVITAFRSPTEVAIFGVVARLVAIVSLPMNFLETLISPTIAELYSAGMVQKLEKLLRGITTVLTFFALVILLSFIFFGGDILSAINGEFYRAGSTVLVVLVAGSVASVVTGPCGMTLVMTGKQKTLMVIDIVSTALSILLMIALVNSFGVVGVAGSIAISTIGKNIAMLLVTKRLTGIWTHMTLNFGEYREMTTHLWGISRLR